jgi:hypothetical protein
MNRFIYGLIFSWVDLFDAVVCVVCLGMYNPCNAMTFAAWYAKHEIARRIGK